MNLTKLPPAAARPVDFTKDIKPLFEASCFRCHGLERPKGKFSLVTRESALRGGTEGIDLIPGESAKSPLIHYVAGLVPEMEMPPVDKGTPLTPEQIGLLRAWIDQGVPWETVNLTAQYAPQFSFTPAVRWVTVSGNAQKFQEHQWVRRGFTGGLADFRLAQRLTNGATLLVEGRALTDDYAVTIDLRKPDLGFARFGMEQITRYDNHYGPYYPFPKTGFATQTPSIFKLPDDLQLNVGRAFAELGLTRPDVPQFLLGYEYRFKRGSEATEEWGEVSQRSGGTVVARHIFPARKDVDEDVHILRLEVAHDIAGVQVEDNMRAEFWDLKTERSADTRFPSGQVYPTAFTTTRETQNQVQFANTLHGAKAFNDWMLLSAGYLFTHFNASATLDQKTDDGAGRPAPGKFWSAGNITLDENANVFNVNLLGGPWDGFTAALGLLNEWSQTQGYGTPNYREGDPDGPVNPSQNTMRLVESDMDRMSLEENLMLRYTRIPFTVLFAEARLTQQRIGNNQEQTALGAQATPPDHDFLRDTDETLDWQEYRTGFEVSPWRWMSWHASYKYRRHDNVYHDNIDEQPHGAAGAGYPAFIQSQSTEGGLVDTRLVLRPTPWLRTTFGYRIARTNYRVSTDLDPTLPPELRARGDGLTSGRHDATTYSASATVTPWRRWSVTGTFFYQQSTTHSPDYWEPIVVPYRGDVYSFAVSSTYMLGKNTELNGTYSYARARYGQNNFGAGLPLGIDYDLHGLQAGVSQRVSPNVQAGLQYGYYRYDEPTAGGFNNYIANMVFGTVTIRLP